jgi:hypothetical protein
MGVIDDILAWKDISVMDIAEDSRADTGRAIDAIAALADSYGPDIGTGKLDDLIKSAESAINCCLRTGPVRNMDYAKTLFAFQYETMRFFASNEYIFRVQVASCEPGSVGFYDAYFHLQMARFSDSFLRLLDKWEKGGKLDEVELIRESFVDYLLRIANVHQSMDFGKRKEALQALREEYSGLCSVPSGPSGVVSSDLKLPDLPDMSGILGVGDGRGSAVGKPPQSVVEDNHKNAWDSYLRSRGYGDGASFRADAIPAQEKTLFLFYHYAHLVSAMTKVYLGEFERAADDIERIRDYELDGTGDCFVASVLDALALLDGSVAGRAVRGWARVDEKMFSEDSGPLCLEAICSSTSRRDVSVVSSNKVKKGTMIIRRYAVGREEDRAAAEKEIAFSRFASAALVGTRIVPVELASFERDGILYHVETRVPGMNFESLIREVDVNAGHVMNVLSCIRRYQDALSCRLEGGCGESARSLIPLTDYQEEFEEKMIARLGMLSERSGLCFDAGALKQAMSELISFMESAPGGVVHNDARAANVIYSPSGHVGLVDLEKTSIGKFILDVVGFVEHAKVESGLSVDADVYRSVSYGSGRSDEDYYRVLTPSAAVFKMSHLCGSAIKYHLDPEKWAAVGRQRVDVAEGVLRSAAGELRRSFKDLAEQVGKCSMEDDCAPKPRKP